jgi:hypothetical protein
MPTYPFVPKTNAQLRPGQFWSIPLSDGRFACGRVIAIDRTRSYGARTMFLGAVLDWVGESPPTSETIAGATVKTFGHAHVRLIGESEGEILGGRPLEWDRIEVPDVVNSWWGARYASLLAERLFVAGDPAPTFERRVVTSPITDEMLKPSKTGRGVVQFSSLPAEDDLVRLAAWFDQYPEMTLRAYGSYDGSIRDLEWLRFFPTLRRFDVDAVWEHLQSLDGLRHLPEDVDELMIGWTKRKLDLGVLDRFRGLKSLYLEGQTKGIEVLSRLTALEELTLRSITLPDLSLLLPLRNLRSLDIKLGGTKDLALLPRIGELRYLELWLIKGLTDISAVGELPQLRYLFLQALRQVERLPDLSRCVELKRVHLETMKGLRDLSPLTTAPAIEEVVLVDMRHLVPVDLTPLRGIPQLKAVTYGLGSFKKNDAARALIGLPEVEKGFDWRAE